MSRTHGDQLSRCRAPAHPAIGTHEVTLVDTLSRRLEKVGDVDAVVTRDTGLPNDELYFALRGKVSEVIHVGDGVAVRGTDRAIFDGRMTGRAV